MIRARRHTRAEYAIGALLAVASASCASNTNGDLPVEGVGAELGAAGAGANEWSASDVDDDRDNGDRQRCRGRRGDRQKNNICPVVDAMAEPRSLRVGEKAKLKGFAVDEDRRPNKLKFQWTAAPANIGVIKNPAKKNTHFKCLKPGTATLTFSANDGSCTRKATVTISCLPVAQPVCGNGVVELGEICDGNCPTNCDDQVACTRDALTGSAAQCNAVCSHSPITACAGADGCCPSGCSQPQDSDCVSTIECGDGRVDPGETCDGNCPASCDDQVACTTDVRTGTPEACNVLCTNTPVTACSMTSDGCCPTGCTVTTDADCTPSCGDGRVDPGETCDPASSCPTSCNDNVACTTDAMTGSAAQCNVACTHTAINACANGDGCCPTVCSNANDNDCPPPTQQCGNGVLDQGETCDDSTSTKCPASCNDNQLCTTDVRSGDPATCDVRCQSTPITACSTTADGCCPGSCNSTTDFDCPIRCGNGVVETGETCDGNCPASCDDSDACTTDTRTGTPNTCDVVCTHTPITSPTCLCGNGRLDAGETCDGDCPTTCEDSNACTTDTLTGSASTCDAVCTHTPISSPSCNCGNGTLDSGETCDNTSSTTCPTSCTPSTDACVANTLTGAANTCNVACEPQPRACGTAGDQCCPTGCTTAQDSDCTSACDTCHANPDNFTCQTAFADCDNLPGVTAANSPIRPGTPRAQLCREIVRCMETQHCAVTAATDCLCGDGVNPNTCFNGTLDAMVGRCKDLIIAGAESNVVTELATRFSVQDFAIGQAVAVIELCDQLFCSAECL